MVSSVTLHDPSIGELSSAFDLFHRALTREQGDSILVTVEAGGTHGYLVVNSLVVEWAEPDQTGMTPFTIRRLARGNPTVV